MTKTNTWAEKDAVHHFDEVLSDAQQETQTIIDGTGQRFFVEVLPLDSVGESAKSDAWARTSNLTAILNKAAPDSNRAPETGAVQFVKVDDKHVASVTADKNTYREHRSGPGRFIT